MSGADVPGFAKVQAFDAAYPASRGLTINAKLAEADACPALTAFAAHIAKGNAA